MSEYDDNLEYSTSKDVLDNHSERMVDTSVNDENHIKVSEQHPSSKSQEPLTSNSETATQEAEVSESNVHRGDALQDSTEAQKAIEELTRVIQLDPTN